jgi:hypothetical protein
MKTDLTRSTFRREKHYSSVRMQQGRVQLDSDWNEQLDIDLHADTTTRVDVIGGCGAPEAEPGFGLGVTPDGSDLTLSPGRIYVDGVLCELETSPIAIAGATATALTLEAIVADGHRLGAGDWVSLTSDGATPIVAKLAAVDAGKEQVTFAPGGPSAAQLNALASATNPTLTWVCTYLTQPDFPGPRPTAIGLPDGGYLAHLDVWQQSVTALDDRLIRETALGGPDSCTRTRTVWQVKLFPAVVGKGEAPTCDSRPSAFPVATTGRLRARAEPETTASDPCDVPPGAGFRRLENQLYRVEIHDPGALGTATFKWSRENGSVAVRWLGDTGSDVLVDSLGRDEVLGVAPGNLVELTSVVDELAGMPGALNTVDGIDTTGTNGSSLTLDAAPPAFPGDEVHPKVRRWEGKDKQPVNGGWTSLEDGVEVDFADGFYNTGDYWLVPARTATGDVEWPNDGGDPSASPPVAPSPLFRAPEGIVHGYCKLAALSFSKTWTVDAICRPTFPPLTDLPTGGVKEEPGIHVLDIRVATGASLRNDTRVHATELAAGLEIVCDGSLEAGTVRGKPTVFVTLDLPYPLIPEEVKFWESTAHIKQPFGTIPVTLDADTTASGKLIVWKPTNVAAQVLKNAPLVLARSPWRREELLVHLALKGNYVYGKGDPKLNIDGEVFGVLKGATLDGQLPQSGDARRGGNLDMWFRLVADVPTKGVVVGVLTAAPVLEKPEQRPALAQVFTLVVERGKLRGLLPPDFGVDETVEPDPVAARKAATEAGLQDLELQGVIDERLASAGDLFVEELGQIGMHLGVQVMAEPEIVDKGAALAGDGIDLVITAQDVLDRLNQATPPPIASSDVATL